MIVSAESLLERCNESFRNDPETVRSVYFAHVVTRTYSLAGFSDDEYIGNPFDILQTQTYLYSHRSIVENLRNDPIFILDCVKKFGRVLAFLDLKYRSDRNYVLEAIRQIDGGTYCYHKGLLRFASEELRNDREIVKVAVQNWASCFQFASDNLRRDEEVIRELISISSGNVLEYAEESILKNVELVLFGLESDAGCFELFDQSLQNDRDFILRCAKINGNIQVPDMFSSDREIMKTLLETCLRNRQSENDIFYTIDESLFMDIEFVKELVDLYEIYPDTHFPTRLCKFINEEIIWKIIQQSAKKGLMRYEIREISDVWKDPLFVKKVLDLGIKLSRVDYTAFADDLKLRIWKDETNIYSFPFKKSSMEFQRQAVKLKPECIYGSYYFQTICGYSEDREELLRLRANRLEYLQFHLPKRFDTW
ncbi:predicted protein [Naegleria gruberi]|uniref:Predicted protein n=1 Tax=Naegleria gruberi TaxID=5762 RepID=D2VP87_NAEGR|nr:uncharacterized protein NAEGRDRAFT_70768 [Naegleria gruberi]EFC41317.1 predicted protein [Naegleria gruberi]|eukprot:XP_002674061.1 predicted protein [Naegleria gruberi strain NEG-M]